MLVIAEIKSRQEKRLTQRTLNKFKVFESRVINVEKYSEKDIRKDGKMILREERLKKEKTVDK